MNPLLQHVQPFLPLGAADDFADAGSQHVHGSHGFAILTQAHVKGFDLGGVVGDDGGLFEQVFRQVAFVFRLQIQPPLDRVLKLAIGVLQQGDRLRVGNPLELVVNDVICHRQHRIVNPGIEELHVFRASGHHMLKDVLQECLRQIHVAL